MIGLYIFNIFQRNKLPSEVNAEDGFDSDKVWIKVDCAIDSGFEEDEASEEKVIIVIVVNGMVVTKD